MDFNSEATIGKAPEEVLKLMILERRSYVIDAIEGYYKFKHQGVNPQINIVISRIKGLYYEIAGALQRSISKKEFSELKEKLFKDKLNIQDAEEIFNTIQEWLDTKHVTRFDTRTQYNKTSTETENKHKGLN